MKPGVAVCLLALSGAAPGRLQVDAPATIRYEEVQGWPKLPAAVQLGEAAGALLTFNPGQHSRLYQEVRNRDASALVLLGWNGIRVGAGPAFVSSSWSERYQDLVPNAPGASEPVRELNDGRTAAWTQHATGLVAQGSYTVSFSANVFLEVMGRQRWGGHAGSGALDCAQDAGVRRSACSLLSDGRVL